MFHQKRLEAFLQLEAGVIRPDGNAHINSPGRPAVWRRRRWFLV
jgi:hypothetical protein